jgi:hypothetical protein
MHGLNGIHGHIQDNLLQLNSVVSHARQSIIQFRVKLDFRAAIGREADMSLAGSAIPLYKYNPSNLH